LYYQSTQPVRYGIKSPTIGITEIKKKWKHYNSALFNNSSPKLNCLSARYLDLLLLSVILVVVASAAVLTICITNNAMRLSYGKRNLKYDSIEFGHQQQMARMQRIVHDVIIDENGVALGGKKAAIQFAYNLMQKAASVETVPAKDAKQLPQGEVDNDMDDDNLDDLSLKVASEVIQFYEMIQGKDAIKSANKEKLLEKIRRFSHFRTTMPEAKLTGPKRRPKRVAAKSRALQGNSLMKLQLMSSEEQQPFRLM
jgi:hypothetical protein